MSAEDREEEDISLPASGSHFKAEHRTEIIEILNEIKTGGEKAHAEGKLNFKRAKEILEEYQEQGVLLRTVLPEFAGLIAECFWEKALEDKEAVLTRFGDSDISEILKCQAPLEDEDDDKTYLHEVAVLAYVLAKVVGPKNLIAHLPHDVRQFEYAFYYLMYSTSHHAQRTWEIRYFLMLWMTNTVLVPFDLSSIDSGMHDTMSLTRLLVEVAQYCLQQPGKVRDMGALFVSRLLTRPDLASSEHLPNFLKWCAACLQVTDDDTATFGQVGALSAIAGILKFGKRDELINHLDLIAATLTQDHLAETKNMLVSKTLVKAVQRLGLSYLKPRIVAWRYQRGMRSLLDNLHGKQGKDAASVTSLDEGFQDEFAPEELEPIIGVLLEALKNQDTIVRWSGAKGIGRIAARLDKPDADDVVNAVLGLFDLYEDSNGWHGGCLALAELARRGLLLPSLFEKIIPVTLQALRYEVSKGTYSVGRHVRDAGCYVCWAFARAYAPADIAIYAERMAASLLSAACFDKEISVRRAAAAAFQECIGRLGNFPHGIDIVTRADYFTLSNRKRAYLQVAPVVAAFDVRYHNHFAAFLTENRLVHHDRDVRQLASKALGELSAAENADNVIVNKHLPDLLKLALSTGSSDARHGAVLGVAEILCVSSKSISKDCMLDIVQLMPRIEGARLYRGRGGEYIRIAVCRLIETLSLAGIDLPETIEVKTVKGFAKAKTLGRYQQCLDENLCQTLEEVQQAGSRAFSAFSNRYFATYNEAFHGKITSKQLALLDVSKLPNERRGAALALGEMPYFAETHEKVLRGLMACVPIEENPDVRDAESRRNACHSLANVVKREATLTDEVFAILEKATTDYTIDQRGDVGSMVRIAAMQGLAKLALAVKERGELTSKYTTRLLCALLRQSTEKLDKVRAVAGGLLHDLCHESKVTELLDDAEEATKVLNAVAGGVTDWGAPLETFPRITPLLTCSSVRRAVLDGVVVAAGGMSVHVSRPAFESLTTYLETNKNDAEWVGTGIADILKENTGDERVVLPVLGTAEKLLTLGMVPSPAGVKISEVLRAEVKRWPKEIHILLASIEVLCGLVCIVEESNVDALLQCLLILIAGRFPKVRAKTAAALYTTLLVSPHIGSDNAGAQNHLASEQWDAPSAEKVRSARDKLYPMFNLTKPVMKAAPKAAPKQSTPLPDANANYSSLVRDAGY
eukprot:TRINITY_DN6176_c1_g2_i1.p1 TRINITY_DN6176_c1_g2~~TRINITY_DN6176_c1_g2_i1.p1  ORF type:complete len:1218 (+),score=295.90 TRINITY_DN6176_c1_g2_i1:49-3654(+)